MTMKAPAPVGTFASELLEGATKQTLVDTLHRAGKLSVALVEACARIDQLVAEKSILVARVNDFDAGGTIAQTEKRGAAAAIGSMRALIATIETVPGMIDTMRQDPIPFLKLAVNAIEDRHVRGVEDVVREMVARENGHS